MPNVVDDKFIIGRGAGIGFDYTSYASEAEAEAGASATTVMSPLTTKQAIEGGGFDALLVDIVADTIDLSPASPASLTTTNPTSYYDTYSQKGVSRLYFTNSEDVSAFTAGSFRDALYVSHAANSTVDYGADQHVNYAIRGFTSGAYVAGVYGVVYHDMVGLDGAAIGNVANANRGVSGVTAHASQLNIGIASNEFHVSQPLTATAQSTSMAAVQAIVESKYAAADGSHSVRGVYVTNVGKSATSAFEAISAGTDGDNGQFEYLLRGENTTINVAAIYMPDSASGDVGTRILYDTGDYSQYNRTSNSFDWAIGSSGILSINASAIFSSALVSQLANGDATTPTHSFINDTNTGMYRVDADVLGWTCGGTLRAYLSSSQFVTTAGRITGTRVHTAAGAVTVAVTDDVVIVNKSSSETTTANLPGSPSTGQRHTIKDGKGDCATYPITVTPAAGNIDGSATFVMATPYASCTLIYNGTQWNVI